MSNGNKSRFYWSQSARRAAGCRGATPTSSLLSQVSRRRTRSHQPHHGTLIVNTPPGGGHANPNLRCPCGLECTIRWDLENLPSNQMLLLIPDIRFRHNTSAVIGPSLSDIITLTDACFSVNN